jgi:hypothetical protein
MRCTPALAAAMLLAVPASAHADEAVTELPRATPVAAYAGWEAWSAYDEATRTYELMLRDPQGEVRRAEVLSRPRPWDLQLGPDARGNVVAIYPRCAARDCVMYRFSTASGREQPLLSVSSGAFVEATPAIWRSTVVFTRRIRGCDVPYVKDLRSSRPSRRLLLTKCVQTRPGHVSIRGTRIVISSQAGTQAGRKTSELRRFSAVRRGSSVILEQAFGEESNLFGQVSQDERFATTVRHGVRPDDTFVRVAWSTGRVEEVNAHRELTGAYARAAGRTALYAEQQDPVGCDGFAEVPCRLMAASADPFGGVVRPLTPQLDVSYEGTPRRGQPLGFSGLLSRRTSAGGELLGGEGIDGVLVELYRRTGSNPERFEATGLTTTTGADGRWRIVLPDPGENPFYTAVAATPGVRTWAGRGTVGSVQP